MVLYALVKELDRHYESRHDRQDVGLEGLDLEQDRHREIESNARDFPRDSIQDFDETQFHVASKSHPTGYYVIDLRRPTCDCPDFPRVRYCKHIAAVYLHFPHLRPLEPSPSVDPEPAQSAVQVPHTQESSHGHSQDFFILSQKLASITSSALTLAIREAVRSAKYSLTAAIASAEGISALPQQESIAPNQHSWMEMAERMGIRRVSKRSAPRRLAQPEEHGLTECSFGVAKAK